MTKRLTVVEHPLVQHKLSYLRDKDTPTVHFRKLANEITLLLTYEATKDLPTEDYEIETPLERMTAQRISGKKVAVCPVLRAGVGMLDGVLSLVSSARVGFIGMYRDEETLEPVQYYSKLPTDLSDRDAIVLDPMLATGHSSGAGNRRGEGRGCAECDARLHRRRAPGYRLHPGEPPRRAHRLCRRRPSARRARLHRPGPRRRRRPPVRHEVARERFALATLVKTELRVAGERGLRHAPCCVVSRCSGRLGYPVRPVVASPSPAESARSSLTLPR